MCWNCLLFAPFWYEFYFLQIRRLHKDEKVQKHLRRLEVKKGHAAREPQQTYAVDETEEVFETH